MHMGNCGVSVGKKIDTHPPLLDVPDPISAAPPVTPIASGLQMSLTTTSRFHISLEAASMCPSTVRIAVAEAELMSGSRPGQSVFDPWIRAPRNLAAFSQTCASLFDGMLIVLPRRRLHP